MTFLTLASRTDAKGQQVQFSYDAYKRTTQVRKYISGTEDTCQPEDYYYDSQTLASGFTQNALGRLAAVQYKGGTCGGSDDYPFQEIYSYTTAGAPTKKRFRIKKGSYTTDLDSTYTYDNEGKMTSVVYPKSWNGSTWVNGPTLTNVFDSMGRLQKLQDGTNDVISNATYNAAGR